MWNFFHVDDDVTKRDYTRKFFGTLQDSELFVSDIVYAEITDAVEERQAQLIGLLEEYSPFRLRRTPEMDELAHAYIAAGALPPRALVDALHVALATVSAMDAIVSWNLRHIANLRRQEKVNVVNYNNRYTRPIQLITPLELTEEP